MPDDNGRIPAPVTSKPRMVWMDLLRGLASLLVTLLHATTLVRDFGIRPWMPLLAFNNALGPMRMPLLMMLSGMLLARSLNKPLPEYLVKKIAALLYPFLLWTLLIGVFIEQDQIAHRALWMGASYLWFLLFLFTYYCLALVARNLPTFAMVLIAGGVSFASPEDSFFYERYFFLMAMFYIGKMLTDQPVILKALMKRTGIMATGVAAAVLVIMSVYVHRMKYDIEWAPLMIPGTLFLFAAAYAIRSNMYFGWLAIIGRNSIVTYVLHWPIIWLVIKLYTSQGYHSPILISATAVAVAVAVCLAATVARERYGLLEWLYKLPRPMEGAAIDAIKGLQRRWPRIVR